MSLRFDRAYRLSRKAAIDAPARSLLSKIMFIAFLIKIKFAPVRHVSAPGVSNLYHDLSGLVEQLDEAKILKIDV